MSVFCAPRELLANPFRSSSTETQITTAYVPVVVEQPKPERAAVPTCSQSSTSQPASEDKPWLTEEVKIAIQKKNELFKIARESKKPEDWTAFKKQRFAIGKLIRACKQNQPRKARSPTTKSDFYCDPCDHGFADHAAYHEHVSEHVTCLRDGCRFSACAKLVELHIKLQHDTGLIRRIPADGPEDVEDWIRQRKSRYPTLRNIAAKKALQEEMESRREVLETPKWGKRGNRFHRRRRKRKGKQQEVETPRKTVTKVHLKCDKVPEADWMKCDDASDIKVEISETDDEKEEGEITDSDSEYPKVVAQTEGVEVKTEVEVPNVLKSLIDCYGSSSEDEVPEANASVPSAAQAEPPTETSVPKETTSVPTKTQHQGKKRKQPMAPKQNHMSKKRPTLLEKLLANEIRHERNILLQCVHFVVKKKFFEDSDCGVPIEDTSTDVPQLCNKSFDTRQECGGGVLSVPATRGMDCQDVQV